MLVQDAFEIVDVYKSNVQAYLSDLMHVTVLAVKITEQQALRQADTKTTLLMDVQVQQSEESEPTTPRIAP